VNLGAIDISGVTDGTSNTAMFSEALMGLNGNIAVYPGQFPNAKRVAYATSFTTDVGPNIGSGGQAMALQFLQTCKAVSGTSVPTYPTQWSGACWNGSHAGTLHFNAYNHWNTPNGLSCVAANSYGGAPGGFNDIITATSSHPGGVNVCFTDGSVHFAKDSVSPQIWWALGSRNQGEIISSDSY
jgi:prepilin-type processing-associated H-X9-DG protein